MNANAMPPIPALSMPLARAEACSKCKFSTSMPGNTAVLQCRFNPPQMQLVATPRGPEPISAFTPTKPDDWCGQWRARVSI